MSPAFPPPLLLVQCLSQVPLSVAAAAVMTLEFATVDAVFDRIAEGLKAQGPELVDKIRGVVQYDIGDRSWTLDLKTGSGRLTPGKAATPDVTITLAADDFLQVASGRSTPQQAFMRGKLKFKGNLAMAMKLNTVLDAARKGAPTKAAAAGAGAAAPSSASSPALQSQPLFDAIALAIRADGASLVKKVGGVIAFSVLAKPGDAKPAAVFTLELKSGAGGFTAGPGVGSPDLTITIADEDFVALSDGKLNAQTVRCLVLPPSAA